MNKNSGPKMAQVKTSAKSPTPQKPLLHSLANWGLLAAGAANLFVGTKAALGSNVAGAATSLTAGLLLVFAATIDRFESLKGLGIEAKTRQLDEKIGEADDALRRLRVLMSAQN